MHVNAAVAILYIATRDQNESYICTGTEDYLTAMQDQSQNHIVSIIVL